MGASKTFLIKNATATGSYFGSLQDGGTLTTSTAGTGWLVGNVAISNYSKLAYGIVQQSASYTSATAYPSGDLSNAITGGDCWRSESTLNGTFITGTWTFATSVIASVATADGSGRLRLRLWKGSDPTGLGATELTTSVVASTNWSNLTTATAQNLTGSQSINQFNMQNEYLFIQMALMTVTQSANATAEVRFRIDATNSRIVTPSFATALSGAKTSSEVSQSQSNGKKDASKQATAGGDLVATKPSVVVI